MSDVRRVDAVLAIERLFERKDHDHPIDVFRDLLHAPAFPRPKLRRDVVDDAHPELVAFFRETQIESGIVDEHDDIRLLARDRVDHVVEDPLEHPIVQQNVEKSDDAHLADVMQDAHAFAGEEIAADAERFELRIELLQLAQHFSCVQIAGRFTGHDGDLHFSGNGYIAQASAIPPKKSERNIQMKNRIRSRRSERHKIAKKSAVAIA